MGRRRKNDDDWIEPVVKVGALLILLAVITPQGRQMIATIGAIALCLAGVALAVGIGFIIFRFATPAKRKSALDSLYQYAETRPAGNSPRIVIEAEEDAPSAGPQSTAELLERLRAIDWFQFEKIVALAYEKLGYTVTRRGGANPDGGIDLVIERDGETAAVQCKQWKTWNVGVKAVREFLGALTDAGIQKGIFITIRGYTGDAKQLAEKHGIEIVNEAGLAELLESTDAKSDSEVLDLLLDTRKFCPKCECEMVLRTATKGSNEGNQFWGCSAYPRCRFTMQI
jgi:HJR/Mrr/RecB family endonuclease